MLSPPCRVCRTGQTHPFLTVKGQAYWRCGQCQATLLAADQLPSPAFEKSRYDLHQNDADEGYQRFLNRLAAPLLAHLGQGQQGLDYGCGPGPVLAAMLRRSGHRVELYDPFFYPDPAVLAQTYDFITCTETVEHFHQPATEFDRLNALLKPGGWLGIMTCFQTDDRAFANWHYRRDCTHVTFYRQETLEYLAQHYGWRCQIPCRNVALMQKPESAPDSGQP